MNNSEITKQKIIDTEKLLQEATDQAETLPEQAGLLLAQNKEVEGNKLFEQALAASQNVKKFSAMLNALKKQFTEQRELEKQIRVESEIKQIESDIKKSEAVLKKKLDVLIEAWNDLISVSPASPRLYNYSGSYVLGRFVGLSNFRGGMNGNTFVPATKIINPDFLEGYTSAVLNSVKNDIVKEIF